MKIKEERARIAQGSFYRDYTYSTSSRSIDFENNQAAITMSIELDFSSTRIEDKAISFPVGMQDVSASANSNSSSSLHIKGSVNSIRELEENAKNYRVRVWFKSLRCRNHEVADRGLDSVDADVVKIEIFDVR